jgi:translocation and assembly module TamB
MPLGKRRRRIWLALGWSAVALALLVVSLPLWFPVVLRPLARKAGATYSAYKREGYGRVRLTNVAYSNGPITVHAESVEAFAPTVWLGQLAFEGKKETTASFVRASNWELMIQSTESESNASSSTFTKVIQLASVVQKLQKWLPTAALSNGIVRAGGTLAKLPAVTWNRGKLWAKVDYPPARDAILTASLYPPQVYTLRVQSDTLRSALTVDLRQTASGLEIRGSGSWRDQPGRFSARFGPQGILPDYAEIKADEFELPAELVAILGKGEIAGSAFGKWERGTFTLDVHARSRDQAKVPFTLDLEAAGSTNFARFRLAGSDIGNSEITACNLVLEGMLHWPWVELTNASVILTDGSICAVGGKFDLRSDAITDGRFVIKGPDTNAWLPPGFKYGTLSAAGQFSGPFTNLMHNGELEMTEFVGPQIKPVALHTTWQGNGIHSANVDLQIEGGSSALFLKCALQPGNRGAEMLLEDLALVTNSAPLLALVKPCRISIARAERGPGWAFILTPLKLKGQAELDAEATIYWPQEGAMRLEARNLNTAAFRPFVKSDLDEIEVRRLDAAVHWSNGPATFRIELAADGRLPAGVSNEQVAASAVMQAFGDARGVAISNLTLNCETSAVAVARGFVPISFRPATPTNMVHFESESPLDFTADTRPEAFFWREISNRTGLVLDDPKLQLKFAGTWQTLHGEARVEARRIQVRQKIPPLEKLFLDLQVDRSKAELSQGNFLIAGQPVTLSGELPLGDGFWNGLKKKRLPDWRQATAHFEITNAAIAALGELLPKELSPQGELNLKASLLPQGRFEGEFIIQNARTRPLGPLGSVTDINVKLAGHDREVTLSEARAKVGGAPVFITGHVDLSGTEWLEGKPPPFDLYLNGTNVPLARQPGFIIRGDLNLTVAKTNEQPALIYGTARLRDSFYLSDLSDLAGGHVASPSQRPPYFNVETAPFADWRLSVHVNGERALRVRSTLFNGEASTSVRLEGALKDPIALGDVKIDSGVVRFPFANLEVKQGLLSLTSADPYRPHLAISATSKQFGYDLRMEVSGTADEPILQFSSTPPLSSEQILLMVTAGQLPSGGYTLSTQQKAQTFGMFLGRDLLSKLGFGDQTQQRLIIHSAEQISETGKPTYSVEYKLSDRWSVVGEYDRFGDYNAGVKWRVFSR